MNRRQVRKRLRCFLLFPAILGFQAALQFNTFLMLWEPWRGFVPAPHDPSLIINMVDEMWFSFGFGVFIAILALGLFFYIFRSWRSK